MYMTELKSGKYTAKVTVKDGIAKLQLYDEKGNVVILDSNGSDESGGLDGLSRLCFAFAFLTASV